MKKKKFFFKVLECEIRNKGAEYIADALKDNNTLIKMCLKSKNQKLFTISSLGNEISESGIISICEALKLNDTLEDLDISCNVLIKY